MSISVNTETTENNGGWLFYDGTCPVCSRWVERVRGLLARRGVHLVRLQAAWAGPSLGLSPDELLTEMKLRTADGRVFGGADAFIQLARMTWWAWPVFLLAQLPGAKTVLRTAYRVIARRRHGLAGRGALPKTPPSGGHHGASGFYDWP